MKTGEIRNRIKALVKLSRESGDINELIEIALEMGQLLFYVQENESEYHRLYLTAYNTRKNNESRIILKYINEERMSATKAQSNAQLEVMELKNLESNFEVDWNDVKGFRYTIQDYKNGVQQKIAHLRKEAEIESLNQHG